METCWEKVLREEPFYTQKCFCTQPAPLQGTKISSPVIARKVAAKARKEARQNLAKNVRRSIQSMEDEVALERQVLRFPKVVAAATADILPWIKKYRYV